MQSCSRLGNCCRFSSRQLAHARWAARAVYMHRSATAVLLSDNAARFNSVSHHIQPRFSVRVTIRRRPSCDRPVWMHPLLPSVFDAQSIVLNQSRLQSSCSERVSANSLQPARATCLQWRRQTLAGKQLVAPLYFGYPPWIASRLSSVTRCSV